MFYYAHSSMDNERGWQTLAEHLKKTAQIASEKSKIFGAEELAFLCGLLHDLGKYSKEFQLRLQGRDGRVDHSSAGAQKAVALFGKGIGTVLAYCIAGHHGGLLDYGTPASTEGTLYARLQAKVCDFCAYKEEIAIDSENMPSIPPVSPQKGEEGFTLSFFIRMLYSCLVDADFINTEEYMNGVIKPRGGHASIQELDAAWDSFLYGLKAAHQTRINVKRNEILQRCLHMAESAPALYSLTVPTGGGKTASSLAFALKHAQKNEMRRIIYVIPYTSIIEQNAAIFKRHLGEDNVLEHHSNFQFDKGTDENNQIANEKIRLASENWDISVVVTTNVQFFESLFASKSSKCRKLHNIAKSVIIFDEAQMIPTQFMRPCFLSISELVRNYGCTSVLCTATQPSVYESGILDMQPVEIMQNPGALYEDFKKVTVRDIGEVEDTSLTSQLNALKQVLCIVNTRRHAREIFKQLAGDCYHLSTLMCPAHRKEVLSQIRIRLNPQSQKPCRVVSTQLIEAGVDVDFPVVYRAMAGIDSIVQSAGRCNREGRLKEGILYVFRPSSKAAAIKGYLKKTAEISEMVFRKHNDPISLEAIDYYFKLLYDIEGLDALDRNHVLECFAGTRKAPFAFDFQTAENRFHLIDSEMYPVIIPYNEEAEGLITALPFSTSLKNMARKLQPYTVSVYKWEFEKLISNGAVRRIKDDFYILEDAELNYDSQTGLILPEDPKGEAIFI